MSECDVAVQIIYVFIESVNPCVCLREIDYKGRTDRVLKLLEISQNLHSRKYTL